MELKGIHHVSVLTANAVKNFKFYTEDVGMRLIKKTVNQDDTSSYHLFYGDERGNAGTELTFFDIPHAGQTRPGTSSISSVSLRVPDKAALDFWKSRLDERNIAHEGIMMRAGRETLGFRDFEGLHLVLVADGNEAGVAPGTPWEKSPVSTNYAVRGLGPVTLTLRDAERTARTLTEVMGFRETGSYTSTLEGQPNIAVYSTGEGGAGAEVHLEERHDLQTEMLGRGGVHHVAFRVPNYEEYNAWLERLESKGFRTSGFVDRYYFKSIYFREQSGVLFELATDGPGFTTDEPFESLGDNLALPPFLEPHRASIEAKLAPLNTRR
jgi:glyoxalase family protein